MPVLPAALLAVFEAFLNTEERFTIQMLEDLAKRNGAGWREARYQLEQWRLTQVVVPANGSTRRRVTYWRKR